jgi:hypothetical protein
MIDIKGLDKAAVLKALYDHSHVQGMGFMQAAPEGYVTVERCRMLLENTGYPYFDYLYGKVLKVDLSKDEFDERLYDRDCGPGAAQRAIDSLRGRTVSHRTDGYITLNLDGSIWFERDLISLEPRMRIRFHGVDGLNNLIAAAIALRDEMTGKTEG